jgi:hypothetical protein
VVAKMVFNANITMNNVHNASDVKEKDIIAVKNATAISLAVPYNNVNYLGLKEVTRRRRLFSSFFDPRFETVATPARDIAQIDLLAGSSFLILLQIITPITTTMNATKIYQELKATLDEAIISGDFTSVLQSVSIALGATAFKDANATSVTISKPTVTPISSTTTSSSSSSDESFPSWAIYVVAIGGFNICLIAGITLYCLRKDGTGIADSSHHKRAPVGGPVVPATSSQEMVVHSSGHMPDEQVFL